MKRTAVILPTMTNAEVVHAATADLPTVDRKFQQAMLALGRRHKKGDRKAILEEIHPYRSPNGNNWFVVFRQSKAGIQVAYFAWYRGLDQRMRAVRVRPDGLTAFHYSKHVFDQYSARFSSDVVATERLRQFFLNNYMAVCHVVDPLADEVKVITSVSQGWLFGYSDEEEDLVHLTTFVDQGRFFPDQHRMEERLEFERNLGGLSAGQKAHFLARLKADEIPPALDRVG